ncbi:MAG: hypothetical protein HQK54_12900, partial [Oligoflexales bacterium]|nr:hypothetical protein [Oligoflexales bacterium]
NPMPEKKLLYMENRNPLTDYITLYSLNPDGKYEGVTLGDHVAGSKRPIKHRYVIFKLEIPSGESTFYVKTRTVGLSSLFLFLWEPDKFNEYSMLEYGYLGTMMGILLIMGIYNLFLYFSFKTRDYLFYVVYNFLFIFVQLGFMAIGIHLIPGNEVNWITNQGVTSGSNISTMGVILFSREFLNVREKYPRIDRLLIIAMIILFSVAVIAALSEPTFVLQEVTDAEVFVVSTFLVCFGIYSAMQGYKPAVYYTLSWIPMLIGAFFLALKIAGILPTNPISDWGQITGGALESILFSLALGYRVNLIKFEARQKIQLINERLTEHAEHVETIVKERTEAINTILNNVSVGFLLIDQDCRILQGFTKSCSDLLGGSFNVNDKFTELLNIPDNEEKFFFIAVRQVFENTLPSEIALSNIPKTFTVNKKTLKITGRAVFDRKENIKAILFTIIDETSFRKARHEAAVNYSMIRILKHSENFRIFHCDFIKNINTLMEYASNKDSNNLRLHLHSMRGNTMIFSLDEVSRVINKIENMSFITHDDILKIRQSYEKFIENHSKPIKHVLEKSEKEHEVCLSALINLKKGSGIRRNLEDAGKFIGTWIDMVKTRPAVKLLGPMHEAVERIAGRCGKKVEFHLLGENVRVVPEQMGEIIASLIHLIRNAIDHGIEDTLSRKNKPPHGILTLGFVEMDGILNITVEDDGQGVNVSKLLDKAEKMRLIRKEQIEKMSPQEKLNLVFLPGLSTKDCINQFSGYGLGMSSVEKAVNNQKGTISISSWPGRGCKVQIRIPILKYENASLAPPLKKAS